MLFIPMLYAIEGPFRRFGCDASELDQIIDGILMWRQWRQWQFDADFVQIMFLVSLISLVI